MFLVGKEKDMKLVKVLLAVTNSDKLWKTLVELFGINYSSFSLFNINIIQ